jgi:hypothetical protein
VGLSLKSGLKTQTYVGRLVMSIGSLPLFHTQNSFSKINKLNLQCGGKIQHNKAVIVKDLSVVVGKKSSKTSDAKTDLQLIICLQR